MISIAGSFQKASLLLFLSRQTLAIRSGATGTLDPSGNTKADVAETAVG